MLLQRLLGVLVVEERCVGVKTEGRSRDGGWGEARVLFHRPPSRQKHSSHTRPPGLHIYLRTCNMRSSTSRRAASAAQSVAPPLSNASRSPSGAPSIAG